MRRVLGIYGGSQPHWVGDGFPVRTIFSQENVGRHISPFLMLDYAEPTTFEAAARLRGIGQVIEVEVEFAPSQLRILVRDDGVGIDPAVLEFVATLGHAYAWRVPYVIRLINSSAMPIDEVETCSMAVSCPSPLAPMDNC
jgi:hypothetical protein